MLSEIYCEEFHQKKISFNQGFNVVLGTPKAHSNSVGKSTLLLIVDFILGGETYINSTDIIRHIGEHTIYFKFNFNSQDYYFARDTNDKNFVWKCDDDYSKKEKISTTEYCQWLAEEYHIVKFKSTLRETIGRYIRVNGKSNDNNPNKPLDKHNKETAENAMFALLKLFDMYKVVNDLVVNKKQSDKELSDYKNAQKHDFIPKIGKRKFDSNERQIEKNIEELNSIQDKINTNDLDTVLVEQAIDLKKELSCERRIFNKLKTQLSVFDENAEYSFSATEKNFEELLNFFDFANIKHISEIENFHKKISNILSEELKQGKEQVQIQFEKQELIV
ncbi:MAG: AAA family ATPase [Neisseriaceae bacterium]|nr:AAA family ATPase [Neisseriaceae bacterium]